jgi:hypothetical protein
VTCGFTLIAFVELTVTEDVCMSDPWGRELPAATAGRRVGPLPARLAELAALTGRRQLAPGERWNWPSAADLPEVAALVAEGWQVLEPAPLYLCLPALWPEPHRCWVPDRLPRVGVVFDGHRRWLTPVTRRREADGTAELAAECGLPEPPAGRLWLLRSPWPSLGVGVVLGLVARWCAECGRRDDCAGFTVAARELLSWPEERVWEWWSGPDADAARAWRLRGVIGEAASPLVRAGLGPAELAELTGGEAGLTEARAVAWCEAVGETGPAAVARIRAWRALGLPAEPPAGGDRVLARMAPEHVAGWLAAGFDLSDVERLAGLPLAEALAWRSAGFAGSDVRLLLEADPTLQPREAVAFDEAGVEPADRLRWVGAGFDATEAAAWTALDVLPSEARVWRSVGYGPDDGQRLRRDGAGPLPPGVRVGWTAQGDNDRASRSYGVTDPPGTRGRFAARDARRR